MTEDQRLDEAKPKCEKPQYEKPVIIDLGELPEAQGAAPCGTGSNGNY